MHNEQFNYNTMRRNPIILIIEDEKSEILNNLANYFDAKNHVNRVVFANYSPNYSGIHNAHIYDHYNNYCVTNIIEAQQLAVKISKEDSSKCQNCLVILDNIIPNNDTNFSLLLQHHRSLFVTVIMKLNSDDATNLRSKYNICFNHIFIAPSAILHNNIKFEKIIKMYLRSFPMVEMFKEKLIELEKSNRYIIIVHMGSHIKLYNN